MKAIAILHEGNDKQTHDNHLLVLLMQHLNLDVGLVDFYGMGFKSNFFKADTQPYKALKPRVATNQIKKIFFVVDADHIKDDAKYNGFDNTQAELTLFIKQLELEAISQIYIVCDPMTKAGNLESFILSTIPELQRNCITHFLECSQFKSKEDNKGLKQLYKIAYPNAPYNFDHPHFDELKTTLTQLFA